MTFEDKSKIYQRLRQEFPVFIYEGFSINLNNDGLSGRFRFNLSDKYFFEPKFSIPKKHFLDFDIDRDDLENLVFHIGMVELVSYWKAACSPKVLIKPAFLNPAQVDWWKNLYFHGLGEFFYTNGITPDPDSFMELSLVGKMEFKKFGFSKNEQILVPVGGGKDSVVTLETLVKNGSHVRPLIMNPRGASLETAAVAGFPESEILTINRSIHPQLIELNKQGFLNGHTPFSALLAFSSLLAGKLANVGSIALSNESSANEATVQGTSINHQYSKSFAFEKDFREYVAGFISDDFDYFSFLRPISELQIAKIFSKSPQYFTTFRSCNVGSKTNVWCGSCAKCLFTFIILTPFTGIETTERIFGKNLLDDASLRPIFDELTGRTSAKPFECVGTVEEVNVALAAIVKNYGNRELPVLLQYFRTLPEFEISKNLDLNNLITQFNGQHFLTGNFEKIIREAIL
jgi:hypothetical protein